MKLRRVVFRASVLLIGLSVVSTLGALFAPANRLAEVRKLYTEGGAAYGYIKLELVDLIEAYFREAREKRKQLLQDKGHLKEILARGALKAREKAAPTLDLVRQKVGLKY